MIKNKKSSPKSNEEQYSDVTPLILAKDKKHANTIAGCFIELTTLINSLGYKKDDWFAIMQKIGKFLDELANNAESQNQEITSDDLQRVFFYISVDIKGEISLRGLDGIPFEIDVERPPMVVCRGGKGASRFDV